MFFKNFTILFSILIISALLLNGCDITASKSGDKYPDIIETLVPICSASDGIVDIDVYSSGPIATSYNRLYFDILENGTENRVAESGLTITPVMDMGHHVHAAPVWQPNPDRDPDSQLFEAAIIPTMPSGDMGSWSLQWDAGNGNAGEPCQMEVMQASDVKVFTAENDERYILTWIHPDSPKTGINDLTLSLHRRESMMSFPEVQDLQLEIRPWMGSMDHGSEGSENPEPSGDGYFEGRVVFNMSGDWQVYVTLIEDGEEIYEVEFELQVE